MRRGGLDRFLMVVVGVAAPLPVLAQTYQDPVTGQVYRDPTPSVTRVAEPRSRAGATVLVGGGAMNYGDAEARGPTNIGGAWQLRLGVGTRRIIGGEVAYVGSVHTFRSPGLDPDAALLGTGAEGNLRLNVPVAMGHWLVEPFFTGGTGWMRYDVVRNESSVSGKPAVDHVLTVPVGTGFLMSYRGFAIEGRAGYRFTFDDEVLGSSADMGHWIFSANIGAEF